MMGMYESKDPHTGAHSKILLLIFAGWVLWAASFPGFMERVVLDKSPQNVEIMDYKDLHNGFVFHGSSAVHREIVDAFRFPLAHISPLLAAGIVMEAAIFRLKLTLLNPEIGPPHTA
jgi:hypothetical protein